MGGRVSIEGMDSAVRWGTLRFLDHPSCITTALPASASRMGPRCVTAGPIPSVGPEGAGTPRWAGGGPLVPAAETRMGLPSDSGPQLRTCAYT